MTATATAEQVVAGYIPVDQIDRNPNNPRGKVTPKDVEGLAKSIQTSGLIQPVVVRPSEGSRFQLLAGERRWVAHQVLGLASIYALVRDNVGDEAVGAITLAENSTREAVDAMAEAEAIQERLSQEGATTQSVADEIGKPVAWVAKRARLSNLTPAWRKAIKSPDYSRRPFSLASLEEIAILAPAAQDELLTTRAIYPGAGESDIKRIIATYLRTLSGAPWDLNDADLVPKCGACSACPKRSSHYQGLFEAGKGKAKDSCLDATCWDGKLTAHVAAAAKDLKEKSESAVAISYGGRNGETPKAGDLPVLSAWSVEKAKKGDKGAIEAIAIDGDQAGRTVWIKPPKEEKSVKAAGGRKSMKERRALLDRKRKLAAIGELAAKIGKVKVYRDFKDFELAAIADLAARFGTDTKNNFLGGKSNAWAGFNESERDAEKVANRLWLAVRPVLLDRLKFQGPQQFTALWKEAESLAYALGLDLEGYLAEATKDIPEPKSWAKETPAAAAVVESEKTE